MTAIDSDVSFEEGGDKAAPKAKKKLSGKVLVLYIALPLLLIGGGTAAVFMTGMLGGGHKEEAEPVASAPVFYDLPEFLVNLRSDPPQRFLKMKVALQIDKKEDTARLDAEMPRVLDGFQVFLRELRPEDLEGSAGMARLREELLRRINLAIQPPIVTDILFKEIIVQ